MKAHGDGWLLTVALIEGSGVVGSGTPGLPDPYVVFTCNGKRKTSSVKFQTSEPKWNGQFCPHIIHVGKLLILMIFADHFPGYLTFFFLF